MKLIIMAIVLSLFSQLSLAKGTAFVKVTGARQGLFKGESTQKGRENSTEILEYSFEELSPRDVATGQASGKRQFKPVVIVKDWGSSSNQFYQALSTNEVLKEVRIEFFTPGIGRPDGQEFLDHTVVLTDATVADVKDIAATVNGDFHDAESISLVFRKITITDKSGVVFSDEITPNN